MFPRAPRRRRNYSPSSTEVEYEIKREDVLITVRASGTSFPHIPAKTYGPPEDCYPAEGGYAELESVEVVSIDHEDGQVQEAYGFKVGEEAKITDAEMKDIEEALYEQAGEDEEAAYEAACEAAYDMWKEEGGRW